MEIKRTGNRAAALLCAAFLVLSGAAFSSCAGFLFRTGERGGAIPRAGAGGIWTRRPPEGLPPEARRYLDGLAEALTRGDGAFLLEQGEAAYDAAVRPRYDRETYLALLYRAGPLAADTIDGGALPRLDYRDIKAIEYAAWAEDGMAIEVTGRFIMHNGARIPCKLILLWRLREPKILGMYP